MDELRWAPPAPVVPWDGVRDASKPGPECIQRGSRGQSFYAPPPERLNVEQSEDCLTLNIWTKAATRDEARPVMLWIHGGGLVNGSGSMRSGRHLAEYGAVVVSLNYRLGRFGFFSHPELTAEHPKRVSGNQAIRDQIQALEWVRENVAAFGGDPGNVTILGESAGGTSVSNLQASPLARGLFHRAIGQSGAGFHPMRDRKRDQSFAISGESLGLKFAAALAGDGGDASLAALRELPAARIREVSKSKPGFLVYEYLAIVDGDVLVEDVGTTFAAGRQIDVPTLVGSTSDEGSVPVLDEPLLTNALGTGVKGIQNFAAARLPEVKDELVASYPATSDEQAMQSWVELLTDLNFTYPMRAWARGMGNVESDVYLYWFTWPPPVPEAARYGAFHGAFQMYLLGELEAFKAVPTEADRKFSAMLAETWVRFARNGDPNGGSLPEWPAFTAENEAYMELGPTLQGGDHLRMQQIELIAKAWANRRAANSPPSVLP